MMMHMMQCASHLEINLEMNTHARACTHALGGGDYRPANAGLIPLAVVRKTNYAVSSLGIYGRSGG
eukprot:6550590-Ditylum_brightwellii.AAC.1